MLLSRPKALPAIPHWSILLAVIVAGAFLLRIWGIEFGLPYLYHPDEPNNVLVAQTILKSGDLRPTAYNYGSLFYYLNAAAYLPYYGVGKLLGWFEKEGADTKSRAIPRMVSAAMPVAFSASSGEKRATRPAKSESSL